jgi:hypothetical protein
MPQYWFVVAALLALAARGKTDAGRPFTRADLRAWSDNIRKRPAGAQHALDHLERAGLIRRVHVAPGELPPPPGLVRYVLTPEGAAAAKAADAERVRAARAAGCIKGNKSRPRQQDSFVVRLWALFRMRKALTGPEAAETLVDAGQDVRRAARTAGQYLRCWQAMHPNAIQVAAQRLAGAYRFVLVQDLGPQAPVIPNELARGGAKKV